LAKDDGVEVTRWTDEQLTRDEMAVQFARAFTSHGWSRSASDAVAQRTTLANVSHLGLVLDKDRFREFVIPCGARPAGTYPLAAIR